MKELFGKSICDGIAIGRIKIYAEAENSFSNNETDDVAAEIDRYENAKAIAISELRTLYKKAVVKVGEENAEIFNIHVMLLEDESYNDFVHNIITARNANAEYAVTVAGNHFVERFSNMEDDCLRDRSADIKDISTRVVRVLSGTSVTKILGNEPVILLAEELTPSEIMQLDKSKLLSFATKTGSTNSHTAILARTMGIPSLTGVEIEKDFDGLMAIVDGNEGKLYIDPPAEVLEKFYEIKKAEDERKELFWELKGNGSVTKSGKKINLYANIGHPDDLAAVIENDAEGIGLLRSEFLYLEKEDYPTEEEQFIAYKKVVEAMGGRKVIIRTFDIGADKQVGYFNYDKEDNPALGYRGIRLSLTRTDIFRTQLRALYRASAYGNLAIMYPMIISADEVIRIKEISKTVREQLIADGIGIGKVDEGILIETPAAAVMSDELAKLVDFFSIGTNDLSQYTMAIDRQNSKLDTFFDPHHPALLRLIKLVVDNGHEEGIWTGICGELGADTSLTEEFVKMGIDELSVSPTEILKVRKAILEVE